MVFLSKNRRFRCISDYLAGDGNDVYICEEENSAAKEKYILWVVKEHDLAARLTDYFENEGCPGETEIFVVGNLYCAAFLWKKKRELISFGRLLADSIPKAKLLCEKIVFACMSSQFPCAVLYQILLQGNLNLGEDGEVYLTEYVDLGELEKKEECDCASFLAGYIQALLEEFHQTRWSGYELLKMKNRRDLYTQFAQIYQDLHDGIPLKKKKGFFQKKREALLGKKPQFLRAVKIFCIITGIIALIVFLGEIMIGENPFYRLFFNSFEKIGTEFLA